jgi:hypothetical protein
MGAVFRPKDFGSRDNRKIENAVKDLGPDTKDSVIKLLNSIIFVSMSRLLISIYFKRSE